MGSLPGVGGCAPTGWMPVLWDNGRDFFVARAVCLWLGRFREKIKRIKVSRWPNAKGEIMKNTAKIPTFKKAKDEKKYWDHTDSADLVDWSQAKSVSLSHLKPTLKSM
jgi:CopG antitoxin of type II toxin-antitoxin system